MHENEGHHYYGWYFPKAGHSLILYFLAESAKAEIGLQNCRCAGGYDHRDAIVAHKDARNLNEEMRGVTGGVEFYDGKQWDTNAPPIFV